MTEYSSILMSFYLITLLLTNHKVCDICWANWTAACSDKGRTPFCPLCNQEEFLSSILPDAVAP